MADANPFATPYADLFPPLATDEFEALREDIIQNGIRVPIVVDQATNAVLDGHHRLTVALELGLSLADHVQYVTTEWPRALAFRFNLNRRNLPTDWKDEIRQARIELAVEMDGAGLTQQEISSLIGVPQPTISRWLTTFIQSDKSSIRSKGNRTKLPTGAVPEIIERLDSGQTQAQVAVDYGVAQQTIAKALAKHRARQAEQEARAIEIADLPADAQGDGWRLLAGDFRDRLNELPDGSVDLIVTDPPYPREFLHLWEDLAKHAARVLKPQGVLLGLTGQIMLPEVMDQLGAHLHYGWVYCQPLPGSNSRIMARHVLQSWKPWLAYSNGPWPSGNVDWHEDTLAPSARTKSTFRWEQDGDPAEYLIEVLSPSGGTVLDPFTGSGAYGVAALARGRQFVGIEMDDARFNIATERLGGE
jgi:site-specific DNA-methyltransferase (adenine-specific)